MCSEQESAPDKGYRREHTSREHVVPVLLEKRGILWSRPGWTWSKGLTESVLNRHYVEPFLRIRSSVWSIFNPYYKTYFE